MFPLAVRLGLVPDTNHWRQHLLALLLWLLLTVLVVPVGGGTLASWLYNSYLFPLARSSSPAVNERFWVPKAPTAWDRFFLHWVGNAMALVPKSAQQMVGATIRTVFTQPAADGTREQWERVTESFRGRFERVADLMDESREDVLAYLAFPHAHWRQI